MTITVLQENCLTALNQVIKAVASKPQLPILSGVLFTCDSLHEAIISGTDLYLGVQARLPLKTDTMGSFVVPAKEFREILASLDPGPLTLELTNSQLRISTTSLTATLQVLPATDFPAFPEKQGNSYTVPKALFNPLSKLCIPSASRDVSRPILTAVLFEYAENSVTCVATDSFRLSVVHSPIEVSQPLIPASFMIPAVGLQEVLAITGKNSDSEDVLITVSLEQQQAYIQTRSVSVFVRLIEGQFPPYQQIIPTQSAITLVCDRESLITQLKRAAIFAKESGNIVQLVFDGTVVSVVVKQSNIGAFSAQVVADSVSGGEVAVACNVRYLLDFLQAVDVAAVEICLNDGFKPVLMKPHSYSSTTTVLAVVMPFKIHSS